MNELIRLGLTHLPPVLPGEAILGYIFRCIHLSRADSTTAVMRHITGRDSVHAPWYLPTNLDRVAQHLSAVFSSGSHILADHTCIPAHMPFVRARSVQPLLESAISGVNAKGTITALGLFSKGVGKTLELSWCLKCVAEDRLRLNMAYWRREHQLPGISYCAHHACPLVRGCGECRFSQRHGKKAVLPSARCWCGEDAVPMLPPQGRADAKVLTEVARFGVALLNGALAGSNPEDLGKLAVYRAHQNGFGLSRRIDFVALSQAMCNTYSDTVLLSLGAKVTRHSWQWRTMWSQVVPPVIGKNLLLLHFFGGLPKPGEIESARSFLEGFTQRLGKRVSAPGQFGSEELSRKRGKYLAYRKSHPEKSRDNIARGLGNVVGWLTLNDRDWYESNAPARRKPFAHGEGNSNRTLQNMDAAAAEHVLARYRELLRSESTHPPSISKHVLLSGFRGGNKVTYTALQNMPRTLAAIEQCVTDRRMHRERVAVQLLRRFGPFKVDEAIAEIRRRTRLSKHFLLALNLKIRRKEQA